MSQFKPGDMVEVVSHKEVKGSGAGSYRMRLPMYTPLEVLEDNDDDGDCRVWDDEKSEWWYVPAANLRRVVPKQQQAAPLPEIKVGDKVRIRDDYDFGPTQCRGKIATVQDVIGDQRDGWGVEVTVDVPEVWRQNLYIPRHAELLPTQPSPPPEITLNGHRYVLAPAEAEPKEEDRVPRQGEVWQDMDTGVMLLVTDEVDDDGDPYCVYLNGCDVGLYSSHWRKDIRFRYATLREYLQDIVS